MKRNIVLSACVQWNRVRACVYVSVYVCRVPATSHLCHKNYYIYFSVSHFLVRPFRNRLSQLEWHTNRPRFALWFSQTLRTTKLILVAINLREKDWFMCWPLKKMWVKGNSSSMDHRPLSLDNNNNRHFSAVLRYSRVLCDRRSWANSAHACLTRNDIEIVFDHFFFCSPFCLSSSTTTAMMYLCWANISQWFPSPLSLQALWIWIILFFFLSCVLGQSVLLLLLYRSHSVDAYFTHNINEIRC